jgi:hypothetical protein
MTRKKTQLRLMYGLITRSLAVGCLVSAAASGVSAQDTTGSVRGTVVDHIGQPIANAQVFLLGTRLAALSNEDGSYVIDSIPAGTYDVQWQFIGYMPHRKDGIRIVAGHTLEFDVALEPLSQIHGRVADPRGQPVAHAGVTIVSTGLVNTTDADITDKDGLYAIDRLHAGIYDVRILCYGQQPTLTENIRIDPGQELEEDFTCEPAPTMDQTSWWEYGVLTETVWATDSGRVSANGLAGLSLRLEGLYDEILLGHAPGVAIPWVLNALGRQGWELVGFSNTDGFFAILKRKRHAGGSSER